MSAPKRYSVKLTLAEMRALLALHNLICSTTDEGEQREALGADYDGAWSAAEDIRRTQRIAMKAESDKRKKQMGDHR